MENVNRTKNIAYFGPSFNLKEKYIGPSMEAPTSRIVAVWNIRNVVLIRFENSVLGDWVLKASSVLVNPVQKDTITNASNLGTSANKEGLSILGVNAHFNPTFNNPVESMVELNSVVLDPESYSIVIFKENELSKLAKSNSGVDSSGRGKGILVSRGRGSGVKGGNAYSGSSLERSYVIVWDVLRTLDIVRLLEMRVSGGKVNSIITSLGFQRSYRVEAIGFSGVFYNSLFSSSLFTVALIVVNEGGFGML
ncbi:hypothetical protein EPI10_006655 [Gossypium australe]|uniref:Uncharacterized protein n=1 Tax=Gossypium australe TaxID=47621 RepID=A0A5B6WRU2_9ROSI|nr:hypothetical protein EPI10_006655 [Gossypium australe]